MCYAVESDISTILVQKSSRSTFLVPQPTFCGFNSFFSECLGEDEMNRIQDRLEIEQVKIFSGLTRNRLVLLRSFELVVNSILLDK